MRAVAESMGESLFVLDDAGKLTFVNPAGAGLLEWSEAELAGRDMHEVGHVQLGGPRSTYGMHARSSLREPRARFRESMSC
jgi:PAS domain S-box-containing protein